MSDFRLRGSADDQAEAVVHRDRHRAFAERIPPTVGDCPRCGTTETLMLGPTCHQCADAAAWSRDNRALCRLLHGDPA